MSGLHTCQCPLSCVIIVSLYSLGAFLDSVGPKTHVKDIPVIKFLPSISDQQKQRHNYIILTSNTFRINIQTKCRRKIKRLFMIIKKIIYWENCNLVIWKCELDGNSLTSYHYRWIFWGCMGWLHPQKQQPPDNSPFTLLLFRL